MSSKHMLQENESLSTEPPNTRLERTAEERGRSAAGRSPLRCAPGGMRRDSAPSYSSEMGARLRFVGSLSNRCSEAGGGEGHAPTIRVAAGGYWPGIL
jgi:hypothetical protein